MMQMFKLSILLFFFSHLEVNNYVPMESKCGAYILPQNNKFILDQWVKFEKGAKKVSNNNRQSSEDFSFLPETHDLDRMDNFCLFGIPYFYTIIQIFSYSN